MDNRKRLAIDLLVYRGDLTMQEVADRVGVTRKTIQVWKQDNEFKRELKAKFNRYISKLPKELQ